MGQYKPNFALFLGHVRLQLVVGCHFNFNYYNSILKFWLYYALNYFLGISPTLQGLVNHVPRARRKGSKFSGVAPDLFNDVQIFFRSRIQVYINHRGFS